MDLKSLLNPSQYLAVTTIDKPILVIAGAGSGKTRVIEYKVLHLIERQINPAKILLLTFTKKAAGEMLTRVGKHNPSCQQIDGGTFHSFAFKILKKYGNRIGFTSSFSILDSSDANELIGKCCGQLGFDQIEKRFPTKETLKNIISKAVNKQTSIKKILELEYPHFEEFDNEIKRLAQKYTKHKFDQSYLDYDDLLIYLKAILENNEIRTQIARNYEYIMVDEYQDTNKLQGDITYLLAESHGNIMVVGDDAQSIYGFRGATHKNIMEFPQLFPNCQVIKLEENYRSTQTILDVSNAVLSNMEDKYDKKLTAANKEESLKPRLYTFKNIYDEAEWIATMIKKFRDQGIKLSNQAVLFRSAYISISLQAELTKLNIPFQMVGGLKFYETAHVKDMIAILKIIVNPKDVLAWSRVLRMIEGVGPVTIDKITSFFQNTFSLSEVLDILETNFAKNYKFSNDILKLVKNLRKINLEENSVEQIFMFALDYYEPFLKKQFDEWHLRLSDLEFIQTISAKYRSLESFLVDLALEPPQQGVADIEAAFEDEKPLTLSTIHSAKGLEWEVVFVIGLAEGILPSKFALKDKSQIEEEHRLFYVAVTRAKNYLYLTMHHEGSIGGLYQFNRLSRFVENQNILKNLEQPNLDSLEQKPHTHLKTNFNSKNLNLIGNDLEKLKGLDRKTLFQKINDSWKQ